MLPLLLCIGAKKAGTSWLYQNIKQHPAVWMPPMREIHYFDLPLPFPLCLSLYHPTGVIFSKYTLLRLRNCLFPGNTPDPNLTWYLRFLLWPRTDRWYASLFQPGAGNITGDITPDYACLPKRQIARVHALLPDAKIIYLLRNPIHRTWSHAAMHFHVWHHRGLDQVNPKSIQRYLRKKRCHTYSDYLGNLQRWNRYYPRHQIYIGFFDQLEQAPRELLRDIYTFLELDASDEVFPTTVRQSVNPGRYPPIPQYAASELARTYYVQLETLHAYFANSYTANWLEYAKQNL